VSKFTGFIEAVKNGIRPRRLELFEVAMDCFTRAKQCISQMEVSEDTAEHEKLWNEFVGLLERAWITFCHDGNSLSSKFQPWAGQYVKERKEDELLSYLTQSRHMAQHAIINLGWQKGKMQLTSTKEGTVYYRNFKIFSDGSHEIEFESGVQGNEPRVIHDPGNSLLPVIYNARHNETFQPPKFHLGTELNSGDPIEAATLALEYYESVFTAGMAKFLPKDS